ncbi:two-component regulator propeller domain-containing protein [Rubrivirga sp. S365]|uniref:histidine kinase n=1 Tax=Rubrivirga litoralis TaxID=3075598 RepID=A0ABU3BQ38_9BACT|nr:MULTISPECIES: two-component regulator propeller domain-containing protein [unclassified Rubrivirga]MDT0631383.1 two-component regulator propeller domain-containing protein [Rubrivirga sp. F394]MDT7855974.1 two-component regulator propeller domain-containing protein [Rubrivirga sp. S365]
MARPAPPSRPAPSARPFLRPPRPARSAVRAAAALAAAVALVLSGVLLAVAQPADPAPRAGRGGVEFLHLGVEQGLPNAAVTAVTQDSLGFVWIGTLDGLVRYDGVGTLELRRSSGEASVPSNVVQALAPAGDGGVWIGTAGGLARFDARTERVRRVAGLPAPDVRALAPDGRGGVWVGTEAGLAHVDAAGAAEAGAGAPAVAVRALLSDADGGVWIGTAAGLLRRDAESGRVRQVAADVAVSALAARGRGGVWVGTLGEGLFAVAGGAGRLAPVGVGPGLFASDVTSVWEDADGVVWVGTMGGGLRRIGPDGAATVYTAALDDPASLASDEVTDLYEDRQGVLWVATYGGLDRFDRARDTATRLLHDDRRLTSLASNTVRAVLPAADGTLYVGAGRTLDRTTDGQTFAHTPVPGTGDRARVTALHQDRAGTVWAGTPGGLFRVTPDGLDPAPLAAPGGAPAVTALFEASDGRFWVGTAARGLALYDRDTGEARWVRPAPPGAGGQSGVGQATSGPSGAPRVRAMAETGDGALWVGTDAGLCRIGRGEALACPPEVAGQTVYALHASGGALWAGTDAGLVRLGGAASGGASTTRYTAEATDLPGDDVYAIVPDETGTLWLATSGGVARFEPVTETFAPRLGGGGTERTLNTAAARGPDGRLYFGGTRGLLAFDPQSLRARNATPPDVVVTGVDVAGQPVEPGGGTLDAAAPLARRVTLGPDQDYLTIHYAGLHFSDPAQNTYRVRLDGLDDDWRPVGRSREASFTTLPPGDYTFEVQAANADGVWSPRAASIGVVVRPPWWRTWWALAGFAALGVVGLVQADRWQRARLLRRERERAEHREAELRAETAEAEHRKVQAELERAREVEEANAKLAQANAQLEAANERLEASIQDLQATQAQLVQSEKLASLGQLTAGIAHEIKNPLNFVNNFADLSIDLAAELRDEIADAAAAEPPRPARDVLADVEPLLDDLADNARRIHEHGQRADRIVRAMLLHSRGGAEERARVDVNRFVEEYANLAYHGARANDSGFTVDLVREFDEAAGEVEVVPQELGRVLINLLANAFHAVAAAGGDGGAVTVRTRRLDGEGGAGEGGAVAVEIADNGTGMPEAVRRRVFEPFFTTKPSGEGTGLGLSLAHDIVAQVHGGELAVESEEGRGTTFTVTLPATPPRRPDAPAA